VCASRKSRMPPYSAVAETGSLDSAARQLSTCACHHHAATAGRVWTVSMDTAVCAQQGTPGASVKRYLIRVCRIPVHLQVFASETDCRLFATVPLGSLALCATLTSTSAWTIHVRMGARAQTRSGRFPVSAFRTAREALAIHAMIQSKRPRPIAV
jgi:hypothetical protein